VSAVLGSLGAIGRAVRTGALRALRHTSGIAHLSAAAAWYATAAPLLGRSKLRKQLGPMLANVGVRSLPIVSLVSLLIGAILVLQTGDVMEKYGQIQEVPGLVALSVTRELAPLMTAFIMTARVGASFTAVLAAMRLNEEIMALETMAIHPVGYLVSPRVLSMVIMLPCLTVMSYVLGIAGGAVVANGMYDISLDLYLEKTFEYLDHGDMAAGMIKALVFSVLISIVCCYYGVIARGGPMGLGRYTMVAVVTSMVVVVMADAVLTAFLVNYVL
jgi:phospholipid/cholesterol/gamma-HCH transport system permease protein